MFEAFGGNHDEEVDPVIQTNVSWIFLALCHNRITGEVMLKNGITRDMFLVSCNPEYHTIRHLVITAFGELGRSRGEATVRIGLDKTMQKIKEQACVEFSKHLVQKEAPIIANILIHMSASADTKVNYAAFWALKDYILLHGALVHDFTDVIQAFISGSLEASRCGCQNRNHKIQD